MLRKYLLGSVALVAGLGISISAALAEPVKVALIEVLSGASAAAGLAGERELKLAIETFLTGKSVDGKPVEIEFLSFDGQGNPQELLVQLQNALSQGASYIFQGNSSSVANAIIDALDKHNERNPENRAMFINFAAADPALTNENCSFWHFRFHGDAGMKVNAITEAIKQRPEIKKVYIIGQDYSFGKAVSAKAKAGLAEKRPDIEIVGDELHPIEKVKDFTPYVGKIQRSGADAIITGNWGADMVNLAKAISDAGGKAQVYTLYAKGLGITGTIGAPGKDRIFIAMEEHLNPPGTKEWASYIDGFKAKFPNQDLVMPLLPTAVQMLGKAMDKAASTDPFKVAQAMEGLSHTTISGDEVTLRSEDHQLQMPLQIAVHTDQNVTYDFDRSGFGVVEVARIPSEANRTETVCKMERPAE